MTDMKNELYILKKMHCPYIVKLYAHFVANNLLYIFIKLANGGNFAKYLKDKGVLTERESAVFFGQILVGIEYMHSLNIAHRDIKLENVLLLRHPNNKLTVLITDFGLSRVITVDQGAVAMSRTICGTQAYMSPEVVANLPFDAFEVRLRGCGRGIEREEREKERQRSALLLTTLHFLTLIPLILSIYRRTSGHLV